MMKIKQTRDLALKILGIFYLSTAFFHGLQVFSIVNTWEGARSMLGYNLVHLTVLLFAFAFWLFLGLLLTFRTQTAIAVLWPGPEDEPESSTSARPLLRFWIVVIAFYFFVKASGDAISQVLLRVVQPEPRPPFAYYLFVPAFTMMAIGILCIVMARPIERWLMRSIGEDCQPPGKSGDAPAGGAQ